MKSTKIISGCKSISHFSGNEYKVKTEHGCTIFTLQKDKSFLPKYKDLYFEYIQPFNDFWYKVIDKNRTENLLNKNTGKLFEDIWWSGITGFDDCFFLALDSNNLWHLISFNSKEEVPITPFTGVCIVNEKLLFILSAEDDKWHFIEKDNFTEVYKYGILSESRKIEFNPTNFADLSEDYLLIEDDSEECCFVINKKNNIIVKSIPYASIQSDNNEIICLEFASPSFCKYSIINPNTLELTPLYYGFRKLNKDYAFAITDKKENNDLGTIINLNDFSLVDPILLIDYGSVISKEDFIAYIKNDTLYTLT